MTSSTATPPVENPVDARYCITTKELCLWYGKFQALINVTVNIKHGQITSLIGQIGRAHV